jgi:hypothetical protein
MLKIYINTLTQYSSFYPLFCLFFFTVCSLHASIYTKGAVFGENNGQAKDRCANEKRCGHVFFFFAVVQQFRVPLALIFISFILIPLVLSYASLSHIYKHTTATALNEQVQKADIAIQQILPLLTQVNNMLPEHLRLEPFSIPAARPRAQTART